MGGVGVGTGFIQSKIVKIYFLSSSICWPWWLGCTSGWWSGGCGFKPCWVRNILLWRFDHEIFTTVILSLPLIHGGQLSVSGERMCTLLVNRLEDLACPINVWLGKLTTLDMTPLGWLGHKTSKQTQTKSSSIHADKVYTRVLQKVLSQGSDYFSAMFYQTYFYYKPSKYFPFTETYFCNLFTQSRKADKSSFGICWRCW